MKIKQLINSKEGKYIISVVLGLGLATLFREVCKDKTCIVFKANSATATSSCGSRGSYNYRKENR